MGTSEFSPYAVAQSEPPTWRPGEELAASAFVGLCFFLFLDVNFSIIRVFKKRKGLYYYSMLLGSWGCMLDAIGVCLKFLRPNSKHLWVLYTILLLGGWTIYAPAQLFVLYSRMHLINENIRMQKCILIVILLTFVLLIAPTWVVVWPAWKPDPAISSVWSPRDAIVERYTQIGFTLAETVISGVYITSLLSLLNYKSSIRQRRIMMDLIYVNIIAVLFDVVIVVMVYLNRLGLSHPIQTFTYMLKLKLEFLVLNQLMAVAARGIMKQSWEEKRYHGGSLADTFSAEARRWDGKSFVDPFQRHLSDSKKTEDRLSPEQLAHTKPPEAAKVSTARDDIEQGQEKLQKDIANLDFEACPDLEVQDSDIDLPIGVDDGSFDVPRASLKGFTVNGGQIASDTRRADSNESGGPLNRDPQAPSSHLFHLPRSQGRDKYVPERPADSTVSWQSPRPQVKPQAFNQTEPRQQVNETRYGPTSRENGDRGDHGRERRNPKSRNPYRKRSNDEEEEDEVDLYMWERHGVDRVVDAPWFVAGNQNRKV